ncbi:WD40-repeat-containing domain protein [Gamsiella multidivaricata]|uniref:WD40-repeat-containing domain protein n=1 Tax=Gamsiella multidivaricata TaxID=101098 RepID=UPI00221F5906|nr:WD40-repeat-containing domain protein [Gamsiella multidivaricata]KAI7829012.1 WD40-repeat-containing domain protein [Gamsiella multidivaricata]
MGGVQFGEWPYLLEESEVRSCAYSPDRKFCAVGLYDGTASVYDTSTWAKAHTLRGHTDSVESVMYSPSGQQIASGSGDKTVRLWDPQTGAPSPILSGYTDWVTSVVYSPSGQQIASGSWDKTVRLWDVNLGQCLAVAEGFHGFIASIAWNATPNGTYFATGCVYKSVRMWQVIEEASRYQVRLHWISMHDRLTVSATSIQNVQGLSRINMRLLEQRGTVGKPIPPLGFREASRKLMTMASVAHKLKVPSNHSTMDSIATTDSLAVQSAKPVDSANVFSHA